MSPEYQDAMAQADAELALAAQELNEASRRYSAAILARIALRSLIVSEAGS